MLRVIGSRVLLAIPTLLLVYSATFALVQLLPGSPGQTILGERATPEAVAQINHELGYDRPWWEQYLRGLGQLVTLDFGDSLISGRSVASDIAPRLPVTLTIAIIAVTISLLLGLVVGTVSALRPGPVDRILQFASTLFMAVPGFWLGILLIATIANGLHLLPATGWVAFDDDPAGWARSLVLPVTALVAGGVAMIARQTRSSLLETLQRDYIRTLRAAGTSNASLVLAHGLRDAAIPIVSNVGFRFVGILGGAVVIEQVFALPGIGQLTLLAVGDHDLPLILGVVLTVTLVVVIVNLVIDIAAMILNPKLRRAR